MSETQVRWQQATGRKSPARSIAFEYKAGAVLLLAMAMACRVLAAWISLRGAGPGWFARQGLEMGFLADSLAHGRGLSSPFGQPTGPTAMFAPVYPWIVSIFFRLFGSYSAASAVGIVLLQIAVNLGAIALLMYLARWKFGDGVGIAAGLLWALSPPLWWVPTILWDTTISIFLLSGLLLLALWTDAHPSVSRWALLGAYGGAISLFNPALMPTVICLTMVVAVIAWRRLGNAVVLQTALGMLVFALIYSVWPIRNVQVMHAFVPLRTAPNLDLWMGNHPGSSGYIETSGFPIYNHAELLKYEQQGEVAYTRQKGQQAKEYIGAHPETFLVLTLRRVARFWLGTGTKDGSIFFALHGLVTTGLGLAGLWMLWKRHRDFAILLLVPLLVFPLPYYITHAEFRFRLVVDPILILLSAYALASIFKKRLVSDQPVL